MANLRQGDIIPGDKPEKVVDSRVRMRRELDNRIQLKLGQKAAILSIDTRKDIGDAVVDVVFNYLGELFYDL